MSKTIETLGGPFLLVPRERVFTWGGTDSSVFFGQSGLTDYEHLTDLIFEELLVEFNDGSFSFAAISTTIRALDVGNVELTTFACEAIQSSKYDVDLIDMIVAGTIPLEKPRSSHIIPKAASPLCLFDSAKSSPTDQQLFELDLASESMLNHYQIDFEEISTSVFEVCPKA